jgi:hypothetical protein
MRLKKLSSIHLAGTPRPTTMDVAPHSSAHLALNGRDLGDSHAAATRAH